MPWTLTRDQRDFARDLRKNVTPPERVLWAQLRKHQTGVKFRRQASIGPYIADFMSHEIKLIIKLDGHSHSGSTAQQRDARRDRFLAQKGYAVLRFGNTDVFDNIEGIWTLIAQHITQLRGSQG
jgi:very-short-patch-repair endonuclease